MRNLFFALLFLSFTSATAFAQSNPHNVASMDAALMQALQGIRIWSEVQDAELPAGTVSIRVEDLDGNPIAGQEVRLGVMEKGGARRELRATSNTEGVALFESVPTGDAQAYRPTATFSGATYGGTPFRLEGDKGKALVFVRVNTTNDRTMLLQSFGQLFIDFQGDRIRVLQESTIMNMTAMRGGPATIVLPEEGISMPLPKGALNFQTERTMDDFRLVQEGDTIRIKGSFGPGAFRFRYSFDLKPETEQLDFTIPVPLSTIRYRAVMSKFEGVTFSVDGLPAPSDAEIQGEKFLMTEVQRRPNDPRLDTLRVRIAGIPGRGPWRTIGIVAALLLAIAFLGYAFSRRGKKLFPGEEKRLLAEVAKLDADFSRGKIGEKFHQKNRRELVRRLAILIERRSA